MAEPKKKKSKSKTNMGRSHHALTAANVSPCPQCGGPRQPHRVCPECGHYRGRQVFAVADEDEA